MNRMRLASLLLLATITSVVSAGQIRHNYDLKDVLWKLSFSLDKGTISGDVTNTVVLGVATPTVQFHCSELQVSKVTVNGVPAKYSTANDALTVTLPSPGNAGDKLAIRAVYTGSPVNGLYFVPASRAFPAKTGMIYSQGEGEDNHYWLPTYDFPDDKATSESYIETPGNWTAIANGKLMGVEKKGPNKVWHWKLNEPCSTYLISIVAGEYVQGKDQWHGIPVDYYVPPGLEKEGKASFGDTPKMIDLYSKLTGVDYPYEKFAQEVVSDFMNGGMENVTAVTQTTRTLHAAGTEPVADSTNLVAHELAHQWFGDMITLKTWEHIWLNEGFATTLPVFYDRHINGQDAFDLDRFDNFEGAIDSIGSRGRGEVAGVRGGVETVTMGSPYPGGCSRILMLMHLLGEQPFWKGIHDFLETYRFKNATTTEFFDVVSKSSGADLTAFQSQWYHTAATPSLTATVDGANLTLAQLKPYYNLDLPVWFLDGENWVKKSIHIDDASATLALGELAGKPFLIDPEVWTVMELKYKAPFSAHDVYELYRHAPNVASKARIILELFESIPPAQRASIGRTETYPGLLKMIAPRIGAQAESYLLELSRNTDERVVNAAVLALGALPSTESAQNRLKEIASSDTNELVREHATKVLLDWSSDAGFAAKVWNMNAFDDGYRTMAVEWWGAHKPDLARTKCLEILAHPVSEPVRVTAIQVLGRIKEAPGEDSVFNALVKVAQETSYRARSAAIASLGQLGNKAAIPYLKPISLHAFGGIRGAAAAAIKQLGG